MSSPVPDSPAPGGLSDVADSGFADSPSALSLCGFKIPDLAALLARLFKLKIPSFPFPPVLPPIPNLPIGINCALLGQNPMDVTGGLKNGGGRKGVRSPDPDDDYDQSTHQLGGP